MYNIAYKLIIGWNFDFNNVLTNLNRMFWSVWQEHTSKVEDQCYKLRNGSLMNQDKIVVTDNLANIVDESTIQDESGVGMSLLCSKFYLLFFQEFPQKVSHYSFFYSYT